MRSSAELAGLLSLSLALAVPACKDSTGPTPIPTSKPAVPFPSGRPEATALENLALIRNLEDKASDKAMILVSVGTYPVTTSGRLVPAQGSPWVYWFAEAAGPTTRVDQWYVQPDGSVQFHGNFEPVARPSYRELQPDMQLDSDRAAVLALEYGGQRFVDKYPGSMLGMVCEWMNGRPVWDVTIRNPQLAGPTCADEVLVDAGTGALLSHLPSLCL
jgi:hypothetical protein